MMDNEYYRGNPKGDTEADGLKYADHLTSQKPFAGADVSIYVYIFGER